MTRRQQCDPKRRQRAALDHRPGIAGQARERVVLRPVVGDQQRQLAFAG
jgi:hypothetical protein